MNETMNFKERAAVKMDLNVNFPSSYAQVEDVKRLYREIKMLWRDHKDLYKHKEKCRMYALLTNQEEKWNEWWEASKYKIGFPLLNSFLKELKFKLCAFCESPFPAGRADNIYCSATCRVYSSTKHEKRKKDLIPIDN